MSKPKLKSTSPNRKLDTYASAAKEIEQEKQMVAALKRLSIGHLMNHDPDLPLDSVNYPFALENGSYTSHTSRDDISDDMDASENASSYSLAASLTKRYSYVELSFLDLEAPDSEIGARSGFRKDSSPVLELLRHSRPPSVVSEDLPLDAEALWVPANMHPEINPQQYKMHVKSTIDELLEQKISRLLSRSRSKRSSLSFSVTDTDPDDSTVFVPEDSETKGVLKSQNQSSFPHKLNQTHQYSPQQNHTNPSLRELTSELQAMSRLAGMDATDAVTLARTLSSASMGYSDVEKLAFDELGNPQNVEKSIYQYEHDATNKQVPKLRVNTETGSSESDRSSSLQSQLRGLCGTRTGNTADPRSLDLRLPVDEEFSLRRSRRPDYRKGPGSSAQLSQQQLGLKLQSNKAGKLAELRQSLSSQNIAAQTLPGLGAHNLAMQAHHPSAHQQKSHNQISQINLAHAMPASPVSPQAPGRDQRQGTPRESGGGRRRHGQGTNYSAQGGLYMNGSKYVTGSQPGGPSAPGQGSQYVQNRNVPPNPSLRQRNVAQNYYQQAVKYSSAPVPLSPSDGPYYSPYSADRSREKDAHGDTFQNDNYKNDVSHYKNDPYGGSWNRGYVEDRRNMKMRSMSSGPLYGHNPNWQNVSNVPTRSSSELYPNQYGYAHQTLHGQQFDQHGYPIHHQQQYLHQQTYNTKNYLHSQNYLNQQHGERQKHQQSYGERHKQRHYYNNYQQQPLLQMTQQSPVYGSYNLQPVGSLQFYLHGEQFTYQTLQEYHDYNHTSASNQVPNQTQNQGRSYSQENIRRDTSERREKGTRREARRELKENLDLLRNEINEFKESLSRTAEPVLSPVAEKDAPESADFSFDLTTHDVSYEDSLGIEKDLVSECDKSSPTEESKNSKLESKSSDNNLPALESIAGSLSGSVHSPEKDPILTEVLPVELDSVKEMTKTGDYEKGTTELTDAARGSGSGEPSDAIEDPKHEHEHEHEHGHGRSYGSDVVANDVNPIYSSGNKYMDIAKDFTLSPIVTPNTEARDASDVSDAEMASLKVTKQLRKKLSSALLQSKDEKKRKKPWPWSKEKRGSVDSGHGELDGRSAGAGSTGDGRKAVRSASSPDLNSRLESESAYNSTSASSSAGTKDNVITKFFKKKRSMSTSEKQVIDNSCRKSSSDSDHLENRMRTSEDSHGADVKTRIKQKLKNMKKTYDIKTDKSEEPAILEETIEEEASVHGDGAAAGTTSSGTGGGSVAGEGKPLSTLEVQERLKKSIKRTSRANQPIEFTDSAFGFPLPPPSHSTLVMIDYRFPVHVERAIYRLSHLKLANPKRSLREQVLLSNFMYAYLNLVDHTLHLEQMTTEDEYVQPDNEMDLLGTHDIDTEFEAESLDEEDFDSIKLDLEVRDQISV